MADEDLSTDDQILSSIGEGGTDETTTESASEDTTTTEAVTDTTEATQADGDYSGGRTDQQATVPTTGPNDLVGPDGQVIAKAGAERRLYERGSKLPRDLETATSELTAAQSTIASLEAAGGLGTQYSLTADELSGAAQLMAAIKQDPVQAINYLLTQAQAAGHNVGENGSGGIDAKALADMIDQKLQPLIGEQQVRVDTQQRSAEAEKAYNSFLTQFPDAHAHGDDIAALMESDKDLTAEAAFWKLRSFYHEKGLDWTKNLATLQRELGRQQAAGSTTQSTLPSGNTTAENLTDTDDVVLTGGANDSYDDIIRESMKDAGVMSNG